MAQHYATGFYAKPVQVDGGRLGLRFAVLSADETCEPSALDQALMQLNFTPLRAGDKAQRLEPRLQKS